MTDEVRNALLVFVGGVLVLVVADGSHVRYVRPDFGPLVLAAGLVIVALALVDVARDLRRAPDPERADESGDADAHEHGSGRVAWLLLLPVLTVLLVAPPALGSDAVGLAGDRAAPLAAPDDPLPPGEAPPVAVVDFVSRAASPQVAGAPPTASSLAGREVSLVGFLVPARAGPGTDLARLVVSCCAADASPVRVHLDDPDGLLTAADPALPAGGSGDRWVRVRGAHVPGTGTGVDGRVPTLRLTAAAPALPAVPPYEY